MPSALGTHLRRRRLRSIAWEHLGQEVAKRSPHLARRIPSAVEGHRVRIEETGPIRAQET
jgi:hypothetical protein